MYEFAITAFYFFCGLLCAGGALVVLIILFGVIKGVMQSGKKGK